MTIKFIKEHDGRFKAGQVLTDVFRNDALDLIKKGIAEEVGTGPIDPKDLQLPTPKAGKPEKEA